MKIRFINDTKIYDMSLSIINSNVVSLKYSDQISDTVLASGFEVLNENNYLVMASYKDYTTKYRTIPDGIELSNDGSSYNPSITEYSVNIIWEDNDDEDGYRPISIDVSLFCNDEYMDTVTLTRKNNWSHIWRNLDSAKNYTIEYPIIDKYNRTDNKYYHTSVSQIRTDKIAELEAATTNAIYNGADVVLSDGTVERFAYTEFVQQNITTAYNTANVLITLGRLDVMVPFYNSDNECKTYSPYDIIKIYLSMGSLITYMVSLDHQLELQIKECEDSSLISDITLDPKYLTGEYLDKFNELIDAGNKVIEAVEEIMPKVEK